MSRVLKSKELINTKLASTYGGWMYCANCNQNIGYLCYVTYDKLQLHYTCSCGNCGSAILEFENAVSGQDSNEKLITIKNRLCCPNDESPLITILSKKLISYNFEITCNSCKKTYIESVNNEGK